MLDTRHRRRPGNTTDGNGGVDEGDDQRAPVLVGDRFCPVLERLSSELLNEKMAKDEIRWCPAPGNLQTRALGGFQVSGPHARKGIEILTSLPGTVNTKFVELTKVAYIQDV